MTINVDYSFILGKKPKPGTPAAGLPDAIGAGHDPSTCLTCIADRRALGLKLPTDR